MGTKMDRLGRGLHSRKKGEKESRAFEEGIQDSIRGRLDRLQKRFFINTEERSQRGKA